MERKILFRGKLWDNGNWAIGDLNQFQDDCIIHASEHGCRVAYSVDPSTVGQYTGLTDKNGMKIFEGDIVHAVTPNTSKNCCVKFEYGQFCIGICMPLAYVRHSAEVIGNIHDNPDLLITDRRAN